MLSFSFGFASRAAGFFFGALARRAFLGGSARAARAPLGRQRIAQHVETKAAGKRRRFSKPHADVLSQSISGAGRLSDKRVLGFDMAKIFGAERARRHKAIRTRLIERYEKTETRYAAYATVEFGADPSRQILGKVAVGRFSFGRHGTPLEIGDHLSDLLKLLRFGVGLRARTELGGANERAVHRQIRIATDRRGEVSVSRQVQAEMAEILRVVNRLALSPQNHVGHHFLFVPTLGDRKNLIEMRGTHRALDQAVIERLEIVSHRGELFLVRRVVHTVDQGQLRALQRLCGCDIGEDHEFLDKAVGVETFALDDLPYSAVFTELDASLRQVKIERRALAALLQARHAHALDGNESAALNSLEEAVRAGFDSDERFRNDTDLDSIRDTRRFREIRDLHERLSLDSYRRHDNNGWFGRSEYSERRWEPAVEDFTALTREQPDLGRAWSNLGWALHHSRRHDEAREAFQRQLDLGYNRSIATYNIACTYAMENDVDSAMDWLERAAEFDSPSYHQYKNDDDLRSLRGERRYEDLLDELRERDDVFDNGRIGGFMRRYFHSNSQDDDDDRVDREGDEVY